jgi:hypothetical protein
MHAIFSIFKTELDRKLGSLFVDSLAACKVEWWELGHSRGQDGGSMRRTLHSFEIIILSMET